MNVSGKKHNSRSRRGATVVEMAVVSPVLITILLGIIEFGWVFMVRQTMTNAAREGVRASAIQTTVDDAEVRTIVQAAMANIQNVTVEDDDITIKHWCKATDGTPDFTERVTVTVDYTDASLVGGYFGWVGPEKIIASSTMRKEGVTEDSTPPSESPCE